MNAPLYRMGLNADMSDEVYHTKTPGVSKTQLDVIARSPRHYWGKFIDPEREPEEKGEELVIGGATHMAIMQPDLFDQKYIVMPEFNNRSSTGRAARDEWLENNKTGKDPLTVKQNTEVWGIANAIRKHSLFKTLITPAFKAEQAFFAIDPETGELVKCKTDLFNFGTGLVIDLKSTEDAGPQKFAKSIVNYRYHVQEAFYRDVIEAAVGQEPEGWAWLAYEKKYPYCVGLYYLDAPDVELGRRLARRDLARLIECKRTNTWPDYATEAKLIRLPRWASAALGDDDLI